MGSLGYTPEFSVVPFVPLDAEEAQQNTFMMQGMPQKWCFWWVRVFSEGVIFRNSAFGGFSSVGSSGGGLEGDKGRVPIA
jgi:hypothetical protein